MRRSAELETLVHDWFASATAGDGSLVTRHVSSDPAVRLIGSDAEEWLQGGPAVAAFLTGEVEGAGGRVHFTPSDTEAYEEAGVGWAATRLTITLPDGTQITPRWSSVFHKEDGVWKFVQTHASIPQGNAEVGWDYG
jgi:ketosteroid isomerase-like protein